MVKKVLGIGAVVLLVGALIGGGAYLLLQDSGHGDVGNRHGWNQTTANGPGAHGRRGNGGTEASAGEGSGGFRRGNAAATAEMATVEGHGGYRRGKTAAAGLRNPGVPDDWMTVSGVVVAIEEDLVVRTPDGAEVTFNLGPAWYRESQGIAIAVGDEVRVTAFSQDGEMMAGTVENLSSGQVLTLRDEGGRTLWSGRGRRGQ